MEGYRWKCGTESQRHALRWGQHEVIYRVTPKSKDQDWQFFSLQTSTSPKQKLGARRVSLRAEVLQWSLYPWAQDSGCRAQGGRRECGGVAYILPSPWDRKYKPWYPFSFYILDSEGYISLCMFPSRNKERKSAGLLHNESFGMNLVAVHSHFSWHYSVFLSVKGTPISL